MSAMGVWVSTAWVYCWNTPSRLSVRPRPIPAGGEATTIPQECYTDERHYLHDERFLREHFWFMVDHVSLIPEPGDYFLFQYGRGDSVIVVRDKDEMVKGFHNVCRHRGSRLCLHNEWLPTEAGPGGKRPDEEFSVVQLGQEGHSEVFRCPYHAWTYDLSGKLVYLPPGIPAGFDQAQHGLHPVHLEVVEGLIFISLAEEPPDFDAWAPNLRPACQEIGTADLKIAACRSLPTKANWKLVIENFRECYHCQPGHTNSYIMAHWWGDQTLTADQRARILQELARHGHVEQDPAAENQASGGGAPTPGMGSTARRLHHLRPGYVTASTDGKPVAPLLPGLKEYTHQERRAGITGFAMSSVTAYDDYVRCTRFTPRDVMSTDAEAFFLVRADAKMPAADIERMIGIWHNTIREDRWLAENNHAGILSSRYAYKGGQPYMATEGGPAGFVKWYMTEVALQPSDRRTE